jgi:hypothetical protein
LKSKPTKKAAEAGGKTDFRFTLFASAGVLLGLLFHPKDGGKVCHIMNDKYSGFGPL